MSDHHRWVRRAAFAAGIGTASAALAAMAASRRWREASEARVAELERLAGRPADSVSFHALGAMPAPVERYFRRVLRDGQPRIRTARVRQSGTFRSREGGEVERGWAPFTATQHFTADPPGFVWDAGIRMAPLVRVRVRDGYVNGRAMMRGAIAALVPVVSAPDDAALRAGALQRWLAEAVWFPTALLPREGLRWEPMDETHARATVVDGPTSVALEFEFAPEGEIVAVRTPGRVRTAPGRSGEYVLAPWGGRYGRYETFAGMRVPTEAEVYWVLGGREEPYYRGRNERIEYEFTTREER